MIVEVVKFEMVIDGSGTAVLLKFNENGGRFTVAVAVMLTTPVAVMLFTMVLVIEVVTSTVSVRLGSNAVVVFEKGLDVVSGKPLCGAVGKLGDPL